MTSRAERTPGETALGLVPAFVLERHARRESRGSLRAATLFADVSGFTVLSGQLMSRGKEGAEALADALRFYFDPLVDAVHAGGGTITGIAGDGISAFFPEEGEGRGDPASRALAAAVAMRRVLERHPVYPAPVGDVRFGIKVGLSRGSVEWRIVAPACSHPSYWFSGAAIDGAAAAENDAVPGEIVLDALVAHDLGVPLPVVDARFARLPQDHPLPPAARRPDAAGPAGLCSVAGDEAGVGAFVPAAVMHAPVAGEFRDALRVFVGVDAAADHDAVFPWLLDLVDAYGGHTSHPDFGDKGPHLFVLFGAPVAREDTVSRGLRFALEALGSPHARGLRAGITFGAGYAGFNGSRERCEYTCLGSPTNRAAHVMTVAAWGEAHVDDSVRERAADEFDFEERGIARLKGGATALHGLLRMRPRRRTGGRRIVGRTTELRAIESWLEPLRAGSPVGLLHIDGEAGMGKSMLLAELRRRLFEKRGRPLRILEAPCDPVLRPSLHPFAQMLRDVLGIRPGDAADERRLKLDEGIDAIAASMPSGAAERREASGSRAMLGALVNVRWEGSPFELAEASIRRDLVIGALARFLGAVARLEPTLLVVEDGHALDADSRAALATVAVAAGGAAGAPLGIVVAARPGDDGTPLSIDLPPGVPVARIHLGSLPSSDLGLLLGRELGEPPTSELVERIERATGGNPFFAEQVVAHLRDVGQLHGAGQLSPAIPEDVKAVLVARIDRLSAELKETVQAAAVLGRLFELRVLSRALGGDPRLADRVRMASSERIWSAVDELHYLFRHALLRDAAYDMLARSRLRELHKACAAAIESLHEADRDEHLQGLAHHWEQGGDTERARDCYLGAARFAAATFAHDDAERAYRRYLELPAAPSVRDYEAWRELAGKVLVVRGRHAEAHEALERSLEVARRIGDPARASDAMAELGYVRMMSGRFEEAREVLEEGLVLARRTGHRFGEGVARAYLGILFKHQGRHAQARPIFGEALSAFRHAGNRYWEGIVLTHLASLLDDDAVDEVRGLYEEALRIAREVGSPRNEAFALASLALLDYQLGEVAEAGRRAAAALAIHRRHGNRTLESVWLTNFAVARWEAGAHEGVAEELEAAIALHRQIGDRAYEARAAAALGVLHRERGDLARARELLEHAGSEHRALGNDVHEARCAIALADMAPGTGSLDRIEQALAKVRQAGRPSELGRALVEAAEATSKVGGADRARVMLDEARRLLPPAFVGDRARLELASLELAREDGDGRGARTALAALVPRLPAGPLRRRAEASLQGPGGAAGG